RGHGSLAVRAIRFLALLLVAHGQRVARALSQSVSPTGSWPSELTRILARWIPRPPTRTRGERGSHARSSRSTPGDHDMLTGNSVDAAEPEGGPLTPRNDPPMNLSAALTYTSGDRLLLAELLATFVDEGPRHMRELREAASRADCGRLSHAAHTLKG